MKTNTHLCQQQQEQHHFVLWRWTAQFLIDRLSITSKRGSLMNSSLLTKSTKRSGNRRHLFAFIHVWHRVFLFNLYDGGLATQLKWTKTTQFNNLLLNWNSNSWKKWKRRECSSEWVSEWVGEWVSINVGRQRY